jgi:outer membrane protein assembly factor BamB
VRPLSGNARYEDWRAPADGRDAPAWAHVLSTSGDELLAADRDGRWRRLQLRGGEVPHIAEVVHVDYAPPAALSPVLHGDTLLMADIQHTVRRLDVRTLDEMSLRTFARPLRGFAAVDEDAALIWDDQSLRLVNLNRDLTDRWTAELPGGTPVGQIVVENNRILFGNAGGGILTVNLETGKVVSQTTVPQALSLGISLLQDRPWAVAIDGSLYQLPLPAEGSE